MNVSTVLLGEGCVDWWNAMWLEHCSSTCDVHRSNTLVYTVQRLSRKCQHVNTLNCGGDHGRHYMLNIGILAFRLEPGCASAEPHRAVHSVPSHVSHRGEDALSSGLLTGRLILRALMAERRLESVWIKFHVQLMLCKFLGTPLADLTPQQYINQLKYTSHTLHILYYIYM